MAPTAPVAAAAGAGSTQLTAIRGVIRELSALAVQKKALEAVGGDTTAVERQITAFRTVVVGLQAALVPKPANATGSGANSGSPVREPAPPVSGQPSAAAARFLEAMEELRVAEQQLDASQEAAANGPAAVAHLGDASGDAAARQLRSAAPVGGAAQPAPASQVAGGGASKEGAPAQRYMWQAPAGFPLPPQLGAPREAAPPPPPAPPAAPPAPPAVAERAEGAALPPPASSSRVVAAQKARLERQAALLAAQLAAAREESSPRAEPVEPEKGAAAASAAVVAPTARTPPAPDAGATDKVAVLEAEIASLHSEIARLTSCSWLDTAALATQINDASALVASVHAWAAQSTQAALEEALASTQRALEAAAVAVPALPTLDAAGTVPSPLDAIASLIAAEFQPFSVAAARNAAASTAPSADDGSAARGADEGVTQLREQHVRAAVLPPAARPPLPAMSLPPISSRPMWSEPPPLDAAPVGAMHIPTDLLSALPPELSAQLLRAAEEVAKPLADPDNGAVHDFASEMRRETEERRRKQLAAARAAAAATPPPEELDSMDGGGVL